MRVFLGCTEVSNILYTLGEGFKQLGCKVTTATGCKNKYYPNNTYDIYADFWYDYVRKNPINPAIDQPAGLHNKIFKALRILGCQNYIINKNIIEQNDVFVFVWAGSYLMPGTEMLKEIKRQGKKIISCLLGSDVRYLPVFTQEFGINTEQWPAKYHFSLENRLKTLRHVEKYSDAIFSVPDQMGLAMRPYHHHPIPVDLSKYTYNPTESQGPIVIHAPSNSVAKGTDIVLDVISKLKSEGLNFIDKYIQDMTNDTLIKLLKEGAIVVDELYAHGPGVLGFEAMACGCVEMTRYLENSPACFRPPVIPINKENLYERLRDVIQNEPYRMEFKRLGRAYVEKNNSHTEVAQLFLDAAWGKKDFDYYPDFFLKQFEKPAGETLGRYTKELNAQIGSLYVKDFKEYIYPLQQKGLL